MRRLVRAKDDPGKQRIRAQLGAIDDAQLFGLGLTSEDIAALRGAAIPPAEVAIAPHSHHPLQAPSVQRMRCQRAIRRGASALAAR